MKSSEFFRSNYEENTLGQNIRPKFSNILGRPRPVLPPALKGLPGNARSTHPEERFGPDLSKGRPGRRWSSFASEALPRKVPSCGSRMGTSKDGSPCMIFKFDASKHDLLCRWARKTLKVLPQKNMSYLVSHFNIYIPRFFAAEEKKSLCHTERAPQSQDLILHFLLEVMDQKPRHKKRIEARSFWSVFFEARSF